jgi:fatty-acyl-CoA synthase
VPYANRDAVVADWVDLVLGHARRGEHDWVAFESGERRVTIRELADSMLAASAGLREERGPVGVSDADPLAHAICVLGALAAGRPVLMVDRRVPDAGIEAVARRAGVTTMLGRRLAGFEHLTIEELTSSAARDPVATDARAVGTILLTSGSSGAPKLVERTRGADLHAAMSLALTGFPMTPGDRHWFSVPHAVAAWHTLVMGSLLLRATTVFAPFTAETAGTVLAERAITSTYMVTTMVRLARAHDGLEGPGWDGLRGLLVGGERLDADTRDILLDRFGPRLHNAYGMTESPRLTQADGDELRDRPGTVGRLAPLRHAQIVVPGTFDPVPTKEEGELIVSGPDLYTRYVGEPVAGEWHRTGDIGRFDADGYLYITGRATSVVKVGGNRVSTDEVAGVLMRHPDVAEVAVVAVDDPVWTTRLVAFVVAGDDGIDTDMASAWMREQVATYKVPREVRCLDALPVTRSGKVALSRLRELAAQPADVNDTAEA